MVEFGKIKNTGINSFWNEINININIQINWKFRTINYDYFVKKKIIFFKREKSNIIDLYFLEYNEEKDEIDNYKK